MQYVEILRARRALLWFTGILLGLVIAALVSVYAGSHGDIHNSGDVPFEDLVGACAFGAWIVATIVVRGLSADAAHATAIVWTRPMSRDRIAWRYIAVDAIAIALGYVIVIDVAILAIAALGGINVLTIDGAAALAFALGLGTAFMWYALALLASARFPGRGGAIAGTSWGVFVVLATLWAVPMPPVLHAVLTVLNYVNPMAWLGDFSATSHHVSRHVIEFPMLARALGSWAIAIVAAAAAVRLWATREV